MIQFFQPPREHYANEYASDGDYHHAAECDNNAKLAGLAERGFQFGVGKTYPDAAKLACGITDFLPAPVGLPGVVECRRGLAKVLHIVAGVDDVVFIQQQNALDVGVFYGVFQKGLQVVVFIRQQRDAAKFGQCFQRHLVGDGYLFFGGFQRTG